MRRLAGVAWLAGGALVTAALATAGGASADTRPPAGVPATVSSDVLPTVQIDGVVWSQAIVGNTVYAGGKFSTARPAGAAPGTSVVPRANLLAYDIRTGVLVASFRHSLNGQVLAVTRSPDGKRLYVGGDFTSIDGVARKHIAAFDTATGALVRTFAPAPTSEVRAIAATNSTVYAGGVFVAANGVARNRLAAFSAANGALLAWNPRANAGVNALVVSPGGASLVVGGRFTTLGGRAAYGLGKVDAVQGGYRNFAANAVVRDAGDAAAITSLATDGRLVFGTGYVFGKGGNLEGSFAADPATGALVWIEDCHGDSYSGAPVSGVFYLVGHAHDCTFVGGWPQTNPPVFHRAIAFTTNARGTVAHNTTGHYYDFGGKPAPLLLDWFPDVALGTYTKQYQGAWSVAANPTYVVLGGEFPRVNGKAQQGLVRFAVSTVAPDKDGPRALPADLALTATPGAGGNVSLRWRTTYDRDNGSLRYTVTRRQGTAAATTVTSRVIVTRPWTLSTVGATDPGLAAGTYTYRLTVTDPFGNSVSSTSVTVVVTS